MDLAFDGGKVVISNLDCQSSISFGLLGKFCDLNFALLFN